MLRLLISDWIILVCCRNQLMSSRVHAFVNKWPCVVSHVLSDVGSLNGISLYRYRVEEERGRRN